MRIAAGLFRLRVYFTIAPSDTNFSVVDHWKLGTPSHILDGLDTEHVMAAGANISTPCRSFFLVSLDSPDGEPDDQDLR